MGRPEKTVVNIAGDGCFRMNMNEIATAVRCGKPLVQIVLNNHVLGMVRQWQTLFYDHRYSHTVLNDAVDFVKIAEGMGAKAVRVTKMKWNLRLERLCLITDRSFLTVGSTRISACFLWCLPGGKH